MRAVTTFVSYAHHDLADVQKLRTVLDPYLRSSARYQFSHWDDHVILPGEFWRREIEAGLAQAQLGFLFLSPQFFASEFIRREELPGLLAKGMLVPIALHDVPLDGSLDLKGVQERQLFRDSRGRSFGKCRTANDRRDFARELFGAIDRLLEKYAG